MTFPREYTKATVVRLAIIGLHCVVDPLVDEAMCSSTAVLFDDRVGGGRGDELIDAPPVVVRIKVNVV